VVNLADQNIPEGRTHAYVVSKDLRALWDAAMVGATKRPAGNFLFIGPPGSGKTDGAESLAIEAGLDFTKVDAASMTDPEAWFGTREIVVQDGVAVTDYKPSIFVESIQKPGITFIDEINRCRDEGRNIIIPIIDHTRAVMNPLTGDIITRHPQNFIIMAGNVGLAFTGTSSIDPAFWTRATVVEFEYTDEASERSIVETATGCDAESAYVLVRFAVDSRARAANDDEFPAISTRELIAAGEHIADGLSRDLAVKFNILNHASGEGGNASLRNELNNIWTGVRAAKLPEANPGPKVPTPDQSGWVCPVHHVVKTVPAGVSTKTGRAYTAFKACSALGCPNTESNGTAWNAAAIKTTSGAGLHCQDCGQINPVGRTTICVSCGSSLT
jgi:MoxR-like ATPase